MITGASTATTGAQLFRGAMEGVALSYQRIADAAAHHRATRQRILASGRVTQDLPSWLQVLADVLGTPVEPVTLKRATLHGTALHALEVLAPDIAASPGPDRGRRCTRCPRTATTTATGPSSTTGSTAR